MRQSFFIWKGVDCRAMGIIMRGPAPIVRPEERVKHVEIPGVAGDYTETEGEDIYNSYIQTVSMSVRDGYNVRKVFRWLRGKGFVTFSGEPDRRQPARIIGAVTLNKISRNLDAWAGEVQFYCQPLKELLYPRKIIVPAYSSSATYKVGDWCIYSGALYECSTAITTAEAWTAGHWTAKTGLPVRNGGDVLCKPLYKVTAGATTVKVKAGTREITVADVTAADVIWIDTNTMELWKESGGVRVSLTANSSGAFPWLEAGDNTVTLTGVSAIEIEKNERYL